MGKLLKLIILLLPVMAGFYGCVSSSNFYTGKTLPEGDYTVNLGLDHMEIDNSESALKYFAISPSIGFSYGLPLKFETGLRYFPPYVFDVSLRKQINPADFTDFDCSLNLGFGYFYREYSYLKYGVTFSRDIEGVEPYIHFNFYSLVGGVVDGLSFVSDAVDDFINKSRVAGFGVSIPSGKTKIIPEVDYQYESGSLDKGWWRFGVGFCF
jgi:hypothetical protein